MMPPSKHTQKHEVLGIGAPIVDHIIEVTEDFLMQIAGAKGGMMAVDYPTLCHIIDSSGAKPTSIVGGSGANTIRGLATMGHSCALLGKIGKDAAGQKFLENMHGLQIRSFLVPTSTPTAQVVCLVTPDKERTLRSFFGASQEMTEGDLMDTQFEDVRLVHIEGYTLLKGALAEKAMDMAKHYGVKISLDLGSFEVVKAHKDKIVDLLTRYVDVVFANREEVQVLTQLNPVKGCQVLRDLCDTVVVLMGDEGCLVGKKERQIYYPAFPVEAVDTTGAGDLFASGFLHGYLQGRSLEECAHFGALLGAAVVQSFGAHIPEQEWETIKRRLAEERARSQ